MSLKKKQNFDEYEYWGKNQFSPSLRIINIDHTTPSTQGNIERFLSTEGQKKDFYIQSIFFLYDLQRKYSPHTRRI